MKVITSILIGAICSTWSSLTSAEYVVVAQRSGAASVGYGLASVLWDQGNYQCSNVDDVLLGFYPDVLRVVYGKCSKTYALWANDATMCTNGAETFVADKADACVNQAEDCGLLADTAAMEVSATFCFPQTINKQKRQYFSRSCRIAAKSICQNLVGDYTQELITNNQCEGKILDSYAAMELDENCILVVDRLSETAALPAEPDPYPSGSNPQNGQDPNQNGNPCYGGTSEEDPNADQNPMYDENGKPCYGGTSEEDPMYDDNGEVIGGTWGGDDPKYGEDPSKIKPSYNGKDPKLYVYVP
jgi:hypothetical protein